MKTPERPGDVFRAPKFNWSRYLQRHLVWAGVNVSDLHPIMGLRLAALFVDLANAGLASNTPGQGLFQITSGVRTREQQIALYNDICLRQGRCSMVANPYAPGSTDAEGVQRQGSNHMAQRQDDRWARAWGTSTVEVGYAVDIRNTGTSWSNLHDRLHRHGLDWPLKGAPYEPWHIEAFPRWGHPNGWVKGPWPKRPGIHRPLFGGLRGGDVGRLQAQLDIARDGHFGPATAKAVRRAQRRLGTDRTGTWTAADQRAWERERRRAKR
jgi:hypothetical protein